MKIIKNVPPVLIEHLSYNWLDLTSVYDMGLFDEQQSDFMKTIIRTTHLLEEDHCFKHNGGNVIDIRLYKGSDNGVIPIVKTAITRLCMRTRGFTGVGDFYEQHLIQIGFGKTVRGFKEVPVRYMLMR